MTITVPDFISTIDLTKPFSNSDASLWQYISKNVTGRTNNPPTLNDGAIYATNSSLYLFGGALSMAPSNPLTKPPPNSMWQYGLTSGNWTPYIPSGIQRIHWGQAVLDNSRSLGYFLGGAITPKSDPAFNSIPGARPYMVQSLIAISEDALSVKNDSTAGLNADGTTLGGFSALIDSLGSQGILVAFGGITNVVGKPMPLGDSDLSDPSMHQSLGNVSVLDIGTQQWYQQAASGDIPPWRYVGCSVVVSAPDRSSHSIYVFGGWANTPGASDGYVYVLSLPSFRWIRVNEDSSLRARHQCALIGKNTMLVVGGNHPNQQLQPIGPSGCDTTNMFSQGLGMFSLNEHAWSQQWDPSQGSLAYQVHPNITSVIGGNQDGGATLQVPVGGFSQQELGNLLGAKVITSTTAPASSSQQSTTKSSSGLSTGAIVGIVVAVAVVVSTLALFLILCLMHRHRRRSSPPELVVAPPAPVLRKASELTEETVISPISLQLPAEISDGGIAAHELGSTEKPLPHIPDHARSVEIQEMEGELGWHPAHRPGREFDAQEEG